MISKLSCRPDVHFTIFLTIDSGKFPTNTNWKITAISSWDFQRLFTQQKLMSCICNWNWFEYHVKPSDFQSIILTFANSHEFTMYLRLDQEQKFRPKKNKPESTWNIHWMDFFEYISTMKTDMTATKIAKSNTKKGKQIAFILQIDQILKPKYIYKLCSWNWATAEWSEV